MAKLNKLGVKNSLWNNIRAKKGSGKKPTKDMLKQEAKIKKEEKMKNMYKKGGKSSKPKMKESWMEESKEVHFGNKPKPMEYKEGGKKARLENRAERIMGRAQKNWKKGTDALEFDKENNPETSNAVGYANRKLNKAAAQEERAEKVMAKANELKKGGTKSMEPGGGGRFAKMVAGLKKKGKSEDSAKAIAASAGRKKYGKSRFQEMAAAGRSKKEMGGMAEELEMETEESTEMMETTEAAKRRKKKKKKKGPCTGSNCFKKANKNSGMTW
jgi:hypothetical protein